MLGYIGPLAWRVWRTPDNNRRGGVYAIGRGHNNKAIICWGGVKAGTIVGGTDEIGAEAVEVAHHS